MRRIFLTVEKLKNVVSSVVWEYRSYSDVKMQLLGFKLN